MQKRGTFVIKNCMTKRERANQNRFSEPRHATVYRFIFEMAHAFLQLTSCASMADFGLTMI
jgi:hypothetical protein